MFILCIIYTLYGRREISKKSIFILCTHFYTTINIYRYVYMYAGTWKAFVSLFILFITYFSFFSSYTFSTTKHINMHIYIYAGAWKGLCASVSHLLPPLSLFPPLCQLLCVYFCPFFGFLSFLFLIGYKHYLSSLLCANYCLFVSP